MMRITMSMISKQYNRNLNQALNHLNNAYTTMCDNRSFEAPSDDPFLAGQTFQVRRQLDLNEDYSSNISNLNGFISSADTSIQKVASVFSNANNQEVLKGINGSTSQSDRNTIAKELLSMRDSIVSSMNAQYGNRYLFSGAGGEGETPFSVDASGNLLYRGINVDTGENSNGASTTISYESPAGSGTTKTMQINFGSAIKDKLNGYTISVQSGAKAVSINTTAKTITLTGTTKQDLQDELQSSDFVSALSTASAADKNLAGITADNVKQINISNIEETGKDAVQPSTSSTKITNFVDLDSLAKETSYVDIGLGLKTDANGNVVDQSAFNSALPGINYIGYGTTTEDGTSVPKNAYTLLTKMSDILQDSSLTGENLMNAIQPYMDSFSATQDTLTSGLAKLGTDSTFLTSTSNYISNVNLNLQKKDEDVEYVDMSDAISGYYMQSYFYQAALQVGTKLLQPTLFDFMT